MIFRLFQMLLLVLTQSRIMYMATQFAAPSAAYYDISVSAYHVKTITPTPVN